MADGQPVPFSGPLHEQVHRALRSRIVAGEWKPQELLPGEIVLSQELGVSVGTVRKAMDQLARDNIIVRERGRGTYVRGGNEWRTNSTFRLCSPEGLPLSPCIKLIDAEVGPANPREANALKLTQKRIGQPVVLRLGREWWSGETLLCSETLIVDEARFRGILNATDTSAQTLFAAYADIYRARVDAIQWEIGVSALRDSLSSANTVAVGEATLPITRTALDLRGRPIELCELLVRQCHCTVQIWR